MRPPKKFTPHPFNYHEEIELRIETLTNLGKGLGRIDGWVVMTPFTAPNEYVRVRVFRNHSQYSEADLIEVLEPAPQRRKPRCSLFTKCGGCQYQHLDYAFQLEWKQRHVSELFERFTKTPITIQPIQSAPPNYGYRSKLTPHYPKRRSASVPPMKDTTVIDPIGFKGVYGNRIVDVPECPLATDAINQTLTVERQKLHRESPIKAKKSVRGGTLLLRQGLEGVTTDPRAVISERIGERTFQFKAGDFFQNNPYVLPKLVDYVVAEAQGPGIHHLVDAYCGVGLFCISAAQHFKSCFGIEISVDAVRWAQANALINGVDNCSFQVGEAAGLFNGLSFPGAISTVVIDPPRKGCDATFLKHLFAYAPQRVVYVSCDPATQVRDLTAFLSNNYTIETVQPFDLFPQTRHIENVVTLSRALKAGDSS